jgi:hypothetical protein
MKRKIFVKDSSRVLKCTVAALVLGISIAGAKAGNVFIKDIDPNHTDVNPEGGQVGGHNLLRRPQ